MTTPEEQAAEVLEVVADAIHRSDCGCSDWHADDQEDVTYREHAQAVIEALAPLFAEREAIAYERGHTEGVEKGLVDPGSAWMLNKAEERRKGAEEALLAAADVFEVRREGVHSLEFVVANWLRERAATYAEGGRRG
ncbi:MAG: hypothetical protein ACXVGA_04300 [Mycobacteriaceae bacterium]